MFNTVPISCLPNRKRFKYFSIEKMFTLNYIAWTARFQSTTCCKSFFTSNSRWWTNGIRTSSSMSGAHHSLLWNSLLQLRKRPIAKYFLTHNWEAFITTVLWIMPYSIFPSSEDTKSKLNGFARSHIRFHLHFQLPYSNVFYAKNSVPKCKGNSLTEISIIYPTTTSYFFLLMSTYV